MSANNQILIIARNGKYEVSDVDVDGCGSNHIETTDTLESAIRSANRYLDENEVEYGLKICI